MSRGDWTLTATGTVVRVDRQNIDKSGRNPRFVLRVVLAPETHELRDAPAGTRLAAELALQIPAADLAKLGVAEPPAGTRVRVTAIGNGPAPALFVLTAIESL